MAIYTDFIKKHHDYKKINKKFKLGVINPASNNDNPIITNLNDSLSSLSSLEENLIGLESNNISFLSSPLKGSNLNNLKGLPSPKSSSSKFESIIGWTNDYFQSNSLMEHVDQQSFLGLPQQNNVLLDEKYDYEIDFNAKEDLILPKSPLKSEEEIFVEYSTPGCAIILLSSDDDCIPIVSPQSKVLKPSPTYDPNHRFSNPPKQLSRRVKKKTQPKLIDNLDSEGNTSFTSKCRLQDLLTSIRNDTNDLLNNIPSPTSSNTEVLSKKKTIVRKTRASKSQLHPDDPNDDMNNSAIIFEAIPIIRFMVRFMGNNNKIYPLEIKNNERMEKLLELLCSIETSFKPGDLKLQRRDQDVILFQTPEKLEFVPGTFLECLENPLKSTIAPSISRTSGLPPEITTSEGNNGKSSLIKLKIQYVPASGDGKVGKVPRTALQYERSLKPAQKLSELVQAFCAYASLNPKKLRLSFDGSSLDLDALICETELEDGDVIDATSV